MDSNARIDRATLGDGIGWLSNGGNLLARGGAPLVRIATVWFLFLLLQLIPLIGMMLFIVISPALTAGLLNVFRGVEQGQTASTDRLLAGFTNGRVRGSLLALGVVFLLGILAASMVFYVWLSQQMDVAALARLLSDPNIVDNQPLRVLMMLDGVNVFGGLALGGVIAALVLGAMYFAVPLVFFWNWPVFAALLFSLRAVLVNWMAFLGFGLVLIGVVLLLFIMIAVFGGILTLALGSVGAFLTNFLVMLMSLFVQLLMGAAQWRAFTRVFPAAGGSGPPGAGNPDTSDGDGSMSA
ncbi:MAG: BPSS1780 family membrane protein [Wenzhouxiangellaceae bacterium]